MTPKERSELINAARSYERIVAERRAIFARACRHKRDGNEDGWVVERKSYHESKDRALKAERLLTERFYGDHDFIRVDGVIYMAYSTETLLRIPLAEIPELTEGEPDDNGNRRESNV